MEQRWMFSPELHISFSSSNKLLYQKQKEDHLKPSYLENGIYDAAKENQEYVALIEYIKNSQTNSWELADEMIKVFNIPSMSGSQNLLQNLNTYSVVELDLFQLVNMLKLLKIPTQVILKSFSEYFWMNHSIEQIWQNNNIAESELKLVIKSIKRIIRKLNKISRDKSKSRSPDYSYELNFISQYMDKNFGERITLQKIKDELKVHRPAIIPPSTTTISRLLKENLNYSFKRSVSLRIVNIPEDTKRKFKQAMEIQLYLQQTGVEAIYIDEFSI